MLRGQEVALGEASVFLLALAALLLGHEVMCWYKEAIKKVAIPLRTDVPELASPMIPR